MITLLPGDDKTCTITNDDIQPKLTVTKVMVNDNGGNKVIADFPLFVGATGVTSGVQNGFDAAAYTVSETPQTGYTGTISGDCAANGAITLSVGDVKACTITNDDIAPTLTLVKTVVNDNGGLKVVADFPLFVNNNPVTSGVANTLMANTLYTATETAYQGYAASAWGGDCAVGGTITLLPGDVKTCTITNDDIAPKLTLVKTVTNNNGGTAVVSDFPLFVGQTPVTSGVATTLSANVQYTASETPKTGYAASVWGGACAAGGMITLLPGDDKTCTITNDDIQPKLIVIKHVINNNGFDYSADDFTLVVTGKNPSPSSFDGNEVGTTVMINAGEYSVSEILVAGYSTTRSTDCEGTISVGETKTCTITNDDIALITRTQGFWQTHTAFTTTIFTAMGSSIQIGSAPHKGPINTTAQLFGAYYSSIPKKTTGVQRTSLDQARMQLLQQLLTAKLNCGAFGCTLVTRALINSADTAYAGANSALILALSSQLDAYNNKYDPSPLPLWASPGSATPKTSQGLASLVFWDAP
jgi:hypothetical protein